MFRIVDAKCMDDNMEELADQADVIFTATPRIRRQNRARGIASRIRHQPGFLNILPVHLAQPVDCLGQELRTLMADFVPLLIDGHILDPMRH